MNQTYQLIEVLKKYLRSRGLNYKYLADKLNISEASVKRLFSERTFSLQRLEQICDILEINLYDLTKMALAHKKDHVRVLSLEQELALAKNYKLLACFYLIINGWEAKEVGNNYKLDEAELCRILIKLDKLKLIELLPQNKIRLLTSRTIFWRKDGPIRAAYENQVKTEFLEAASFESTQNKLYFEVGELSTASYLIIRRKIERLVKEFEELVEIDSTLVPQERKSTGLLMGFRPWDFSSFVSDEPYFDEDMKLNR